MDIKSPEERSKNMAAIRSRDTKPELLLRKKLFKKGLRYRITNKLPGKPDIIFPQLKIAVFVDGCFWHRCPECYKQPENNYLFWEEKISSNVRRDRLVNEKLSRDGWKVIRFWEHEIYRDLDGVAERIYVQVKPGL
jgi:DNA mismatch endonuclease, patch repair protein